MRNIFKYSTLLSILISSNLIAKDLPKEINDKRTNFNYEKYQERYKFPKINKNKQVYSYPFISNSNFTDQYITPLFDKPKEDISEKRKSQFSNENKLEIEKWVMPDLIASKYFDHLNVNQQSKLKCPITPKLKHIVKKEEEKYMPKTFSYSNNLRRKVKMPEVAAGDIIYIEGQVQDINCTPISSATIRLWQTDAYGMIDIKNIDSDFEGHGTSVTNNLGVFSFITILPGSRNNIAPHININISHSNFESIDTKIYFPQHQLNYQDMLYSSLDRFNSNLITSELIPVNFSNLSEGYMMLFNITLDGVSPYNNVN